MQFKKIKSYAKINLALNVLGKSSKLHKIESLVAFINIYDLILIKRINKKNHIVKFRGKFSKNINSNNSVTKLLRILDKKKLLQEKFHIEIVKHVPQQSGLGGGSMNASAILNYLLKKNKKTISEKKLAQICNKIGSDVILGLKKKNSILLGNGKLIRSQSKLKFHIPHFKYTTRVFLTKKVDYSLYYC